MTSKRFDWNETVYVAQGDLGKGLFAKRFIEEGETILKFSGPLITFKEAVAKGELQCWPLQIDDDFYVDLEPPGCYGNHSCNPNAGVRNDLYLVALTDIQPDAEIRYDYSTTMDEDYFTMKCLCGSAECRQEVTDFKFLPESIRERYLSLRIVQSFIAQRIAQLSLARDGARASSLVNVAAEKLRQGAGPHAAASGQGV